MRFALINGMFAVPYAQLFRLARKYYGLSAVIVAFAQLFVIMHQISAASAVTRNNNQHMIVMQDKGALPMLESPASATV